MTAQLELLNAMLASIAEFKKGIIWNVNGKVLKSQKVGSVVRSTF